jgi:hypothetical protein
MQKLMRIKIIGDNNCARATRHLLRKAGLAVTEFLPADVVTQAPHSGYVITIDLAPAPHTPDPTTKPDHSTHGQSAPGIGEASPSHGGASSPTLPGAEWSRNPPGGSGILPAGLLTEHLESRRRDVGATRGSSIHFDSVDSELEAAILRHVTQLAAAPVVVDRPGGIVHSERELRIVVPNSGDAKADEGAAVAVEFGVLRGLLDLTAPTPTPLRKLRETLAYTSAGAPGISPNAAGKKWWKFGLVLVSGAALALAGSLHASLRRAAIERERVIEARELDGAYPRSTDVNSICLAGCPSSVRTSKSPTHHSPAKASLPRRDGEYSPYPLGVTNDSMSATTSGNAGALRSTTDRMLDVNLGKLGGAAVSGANVDDSRNTAFRFNCVVGCSAFAGFTDNSAITAGTTSEANIGGIFDGSVPWLAQSKPTEALLIACCRVHASATPVLLEPAHSVAVPLADRASFLPAAAIAAQGQFATGQAPVKITDGTNTLVVDPCKAQTKLYVSINQTANTQLVAGTASKKIYICSIHVVVAIATNAALVEGTGSVCATGTAGVSGFGGATAATGWNFAANGGIVLGNGDAAVGAEGTNADNLCLFNSGSGQVSGGISYVVQ